MTWNPKQRLLTIEEAAKSVGRPPSTIRRWLAEGRLTPYARQGRSPLILESDALLAEADTRTKRARTVTGTWDNVGTPRER